MACETPDKRREKFWQKCYLIAYKRFLRNATDATFIAMKAAAHADRALKALLVRFDVAGDPGEGTDTCA